jgi:uncharacterized protein YdeI (BOF family)
MGNDFVIAKGGPVFTGLLILVTLLAGCLGQVGGSGTEGGTGQQSSAPVTGIGKILENPEAYENQTVVIEGRITAECGSGCWLILDDGTGSMYVDLNAGNFAIPQKIGANAVAQGNVSLGRGNPSLLGQRVEVDGKEYP